ncbi:MULTISPECIES: putative glycolipid-binding domain-containing protein [Halorussus]|uniref:putative glycolipid-binding domain-containing protein n=1 Tax=Halorussus TaxID=1070314 RepID=UPI0020A0D44C|nr:putative glycolipid-binding domain-containing protein [Halorussus vallis]USZ76649.1 putative glycolipid-binding domain-containing protein [Halorussus vallis]
MHRDAFWTPVEETGIEHLRLDEDEAGVAATGVVVGTNDDRPFRVYYEIDCDRRWHTRRVHVATLGRTAASTTLRADGDGTWFDGRGEERPALAGATDVDVSARPFTNLLPIRRLNLDAGESAELTVAYVSVPELRIEADVQRYTCLDSLDEEGGRFRYDAVDGDFTAELAVDGDGLVVEYPGLFSRLDPS